MSKGEDRILALTASSQVYFLRWPHEYFQLAVIGVLWLSGHILAERTVWIRLAGATGAALFGIAWTASRLVELSA